MGYWEISSPMRNTNFSSSSRFYEPNVKLLKSRYQSNCKLLEKYPYLFRRDFLDFEFLPLRFYRRCVRTAGCAKSAC